MARQILIESGDIRVDAELNDSPSVARIWAAMPLKAVASRWGGEIYFDIGIACPLDDDARTQMDVGELGYWPVGRSFCIFFGPTPASGPDHKPRAASRVNVIGRVVGSVDVLRNIFDGQEIVLRAAP